ncbi:DUF1746-domain-containing protein [Ascobolus immersus RN42]|uniref:DUF1746-domain-containing protein n=1 Tax=Ascobolus immersus RN42 TaxID=1160509 RepID=A0A3N4I9P8_ASCIM|nr:DUF1746-domain-containing protein [Ascobolus immersus RN42]
MNNDHSTADPRPSPRNPHRSNPSRTRPTPTAAPNTRPLFSFLSRSTPRARRPSVSSDSSDSDSTPDQPTPNASSAPPPTQGPAPPNTQQTITSNIDTLASGLLANATATTAGGRAAVSRDILNAAKTVRSEKIRFLKDLLRNLDALVYAHLSYLYYLDNSLLLFLFRGSMVQLSFLTPKPAVLPPVPLHRLVLISIIGSAALCFLIHTLSDAPSAGEASGGYLHGGILIDFIGQATPISRVRLALLDTFVMFLQLIMLSTTLSLRSLTHKKVRRQDLDSEERGVHRDSLDLESGTSGLGPGATAAAAATGESPTNSETSDTTDEESPLFNSEPPAEELDNLYEAYAGELVVAEVRLVEMCKNLWFGPREELRLRPGTV